MPLLLPAAEETQTGSGGTRCRRRAFWASFQSRKGPKLSSAPSHGWNSDYLTHETRTEMMFPGLFHFLRISHCFLAQSPTFRTTDRNRDIFLRILCSLYVCFVCAWFGKSTERNFQRSKRTQFRLEVDSTYKWKFQKHKLVNLDSPMHWKSVKAMQYKKAINRLEKFYDIFFRLSVERKKLVKEEKRNGARWKRREREIKVSGK